MGLRQKSTQNHIRRGIDTLLTYGAPVWEEAAAKQKNKRMLERVQRLINIKIAKAYRTISFEASCMMAGVPPIGLVIEEKASQYRIKHNPECDLPLPVTEWPHPTQRWNGRVTLSEDQEVEIQNWPNLVDEVKTTKDKEYEQ